MDAGVLTTAAVLRGGAAALRDGLHLGEVVVLCMLCVLLVVFLHLLCGVLLHRVLLDGTQMLLLLPLLLLVVGVVLHMHLLHLLLLLLLQQLLMLVLVLVLRLHAFV